MMTRSSSQPIGLFDSGVGGLAVLDTLVQALPQESFVALGDTVNMPYGKKPLSFIRSRVETLLNWFMTEHQVKAIVVACNTSSVTIPEVRAQFSPPILTVDPVTSIATCLAQAPYRKVGLLATLTTVQGNYYATTLQAVNPSIELKSVGCPLLASEIEAGRFEGLAIQELLKMRLAPLLDWGMEALILGCTHYPLAMAAFREVLPETVKVLDPAQAMADVLHDTLATASLLLPPESPVGKQSFYVTADPGSFKTVAQSLPFQALGPLLERQTIHQVDIHPCPAIIE